MLFEQDTLIAAAAALLYLLICVTALLRRGLKERQARWLILYTAMALFYSLLPLLSWLGRNGDLPPIPGDFLWSYGALIMAWLFLHLSRSFLRLDGPGLGWWVLGTLCLAAAVVLDFDLMALPARLGIAEVWRGSARAITFPLLLAGWATFMAGVFALTIGVYRQTQQPLHQNRIKYWPLVWGFTALGGGLGLAGRQALGSAFSLVGASMAAYAVLTHRLPDIRQTARQFMAYLIVTLTTMALFAGSLAAGRYLVLRAAPDYATLLVGMASALALAMLFRPLLVWIQRGMNRLIPATEYDPDRALREYSLSISNILSLERLATVIVGLIGEAMAIRQGTLFLVSRQNGNNGQGPHNGSFVLQAVRAAGQDQSPVGTLAAQSPVAQCLRREHRPLTQYDVDLLPRFRAMPPSERAWLASLDMDVYVPIYAKGEWIGLLALGPKVSGDRYFDPDLALLSTLADQTAVALENARLFQDLQMRNAENERLNEELAVANRELARLDEAKSDFINVASHELRTPLTQVRGYTDILNEMSRDGSLSPELAAQMTQGIGKASQRLEEIINLMFDVSQIDTQTLSLNPSEVSLAAIVAGVSDSWAAAFEERRQTLSVAGLAGLPLILADGKRLGQVFSHLVQNAIKYTPDGGQIQISGRLLGEGVLPPDQSIEVVVADTGIGIAAQDRERIFEKFYRVGNVLLHSTGRTKFKGAGPGLGLTIARGIVEAHGGRIWVESPGHDEAACPGSRFHVVLPVQPRHLEAEDATAFMASLKR
ncbi:MAG: ATP-binding protein [Chloroflexota bacterium]